MLPDWIRFDDALDVTDIVQGCSRDLGPGQFHFIKDRTGNKYLWLRNNGSTFVSQAVDSLTFTLLAFYGVFANEVIWQIILFTYLVKLIVAVIDTPFIYLSKLKCLRPLDKN